MFAVFNQGEDDLIRAAPLSSYIKLIVTNWMTVFLSDKNVNIHIDIVTLQ